MVDPASLDVGSLGDQLAEPHLFELLGDAVIGILLITEVEISSDQGGFVICDQDLQCSLGFYDWTLAGSVYVDWHKLRRK